MDSVTKIGYFIDTGADVSVLPPIPEDRRYPSSNTQLQTANGSSIKTFGQRAVQVELGLAKVFVWKFTVAEVTKPIFGTDLLRHFGMLVDLRLKRLMDAETYVTVPASYNRSTMSNLCVLVKKK